MKIPLKKDTQIDFLLFFKIYYLIFTKINVKEEEMEEGERALDEQDEQNDGENEKDEMTKKLEYYENEKNYAYDEAEGEQEEGEYVGDKGEEEEQ